MISGPGIHRGVPIDAYIADQLLAVPTLSSGCAHTVEATSPLHAWFSHPRLNPHYSRDASNQADIGSVAHDVLLEGGTDCVCVIDPAEHPSEPKKKGEAGTIPKGWTNKSIREARDAARASGRYPILKPDAAAVFSMVDAAREFIERTEFRGIFARATAEQTMIWQEGPVFLRARPDLMANDLSVLLHYKSTRANAGPSAFARIADGSGYDFALMFYARGLAELEPQRAQRTRHIILAQEQQAPYACALYDLAPAKAALASSRVDRAIDTWARCLRTNRWPAYDTRVHSLEPKPWELAAEEDKAVFYGLGTPDPLQADGVQA